MFKRGSDIAEGIPKIGGGGNKSQQTNADIIQVDTSPHGVKLPTLPADLLAGFGWYVEPAPPLEDMGSQSRSKGRFIPLKYNSIEEANRAFSC